MSSWLIYSVKSAGLVVRTLIAIWIALHIAIDPAQADGNVPSRRILAVYDGAREIEARATRIHRHAEVVLNHLGYVVDYADARFPLPGPAQMSAYAGAISWFPQSLPAAQGDMYANWAVMLLASGRPLVSLGEIGPDPWGGGRDKANQILSFYAVVHTGRGVTLTAGTRAVTSNADVIGFERPLDPAPPPFAIVEPAATGRRNEDILLEVESPHRERSRSSIIVLAGRLGGFVAPGFSLSTDGRTGQVSGWMINPFTFFKRAFSTPFAPVPDVTTVSNRRAFFATVDGSGLNSVLKTRGERRERLYADVLREEIVEAHPDLPFSIGAVAADLDPQRPGNSGIRAAVTKLFGLRNVEAAITHGGTPHSVSSGDDKPPPLQTAQDHQKANTPGPGHAAAAEAARERDIVNGLTRPENPAKLYQWSGDARPSNMVAAARDIGMANINGGDGRFDFDDASLSYLAPLAAPPVDAARPNVRQIYAAASGGSTTTTFWRPPQDALALLSHTFANTAVPRLKPLGLHLVAQWVGNKQNRDLIQTYLDGIEHAPVIPIKTSEYSAAVDGFLSARIVPAGHRRWVVADRGALQTVRIDGGQGDAVDFANSSGVTGFRHDNGALYIALDPAVAEPVIALSARGGSLTPKSLGAQNLADSRWRVRSVVRQPCLFRFEADGYGSGSFVWTGVDPGRHAITAEHGGRIVWNAVVQADSEVLRFKIPDTATGSTRQPLTVTAACETSSRTGDLK